MFDWSFGTLQVADLGVSNLGPATSPQLLLSHLTSKKTPIEYNTLCGTSPSSSINGFPLSESFIINPRRACTGGLR